MPSCVAPTEIRTPIPNAGRSRPPLEFVGGKQPVGDRHGNRLGHDAIMRLFSLDKKAACPDRSLSEESQAPLSLRMAPLSRIRQYDKANGARPKAWNRPNGRERLPMERPLRRSNAPRLRGLMGRLTAGGRRTRSTCLHVGPSGNQTFASARLTFDVHLLFSVR